MVLRPATWRWTKTSARWLGLIRGSFLDSNDSSSEARCHHGDSVAVAYRAQEVVCFRTSDGQVFRRFVAETLGLYPFEQIIGAFCARGQHRDALLLLCRADHGPCAAHSARLLEVSLQSSTGAPTVHPVSLNNLHGGGSRLFRPESMTNTTPLNTAFPPVFAPETFVTTVPSTNLPDRTHQNKNSRTDLYFLHQVLVAGCGQAPVVLTLLTSAASAPFYFEAMTMLRHEGLARAWPWASRLGWPLPRACVLLGCTCSVCRRLERQPSRLVIALVLYDRVLGMLCWRCPAANRPMARPDRSAETWTEFLQPLPAWVFLDASTPELRLTEDLLWPARSRYDACPYRGHCPDLRVDEMLVCGGRMIWTLADWRLELPTRLEADPGPNALVTVRWLRLTEHADAEAAVIPLGGCVDSFRFRDAQDRSRLLVAYANGLVLELGAQSPPSAESMWQEHRHEYLTDLRPLEELLGFINARLLITTFGRLMKLTSLLSREPLNRPSLTEADFASDSTMPSHWFGAPDAAETLTAAVAFGQGPVSLSNAQSPSCARVSYVRALWSPEDGAILESSQYGLVVHSLLQRQLMMRGKPTRLFVLERDATVMVLATSDFPERHTQTLQLKQFGETFQINETDALFCENDTTIAVHHWHQWSEAIQVCGHQLVLFRWHNQSWLPLRREATDRLVDAFATDNERLFVLGLGPILCLWMRSGSNAPFWHPYASVALEAPVATLALDHESLKASCWTRECWLIFPLHWQSDTQVSLGLPVCKAFFPPATSSGNGSDCHHHAFQPSAGPLRGLIHLPELSPPTELLAFANGELVVNGSLRVQLGFADLQLRPCSSSGGAGLPTSPRKPGEHTMRRGLSKDGANASEKANESPEVEDNFCSNTEAHVLFIIDGQVWMGVTTASCQTMVEPQVLTLWPLIMPATQKKPLLDCQAVWLTSILETSTGTEAGKFCASSRQLPLLWLDTDAMLHLGLVGLSLDARCSRQRAGKQPITVLEYDECTASVWTLLEGRPAALEPELLEPRVIHDSQGVLTDHFIDLRLAPVKPGNQKTPTSSVEQSTANRCLMAFQSAHQAIYLAEARLQSDGIWLIACVIFPDTQQTTESAGVPSQEEERVHLETSLVPETMLLSIERPRSSLFEAWTRSFASSSADHATSSWRPERVARLTLTGVDTFRLDPWSRPPALLDVAALDTMTLSGLYADAPESIPFQPGQHVELWQPNGSNHLHVVAYGARQRVRLDALGLVVDSLSESARGFCWQSRQGPWPWPACRVPCRYQLDVPALGMVLASTNNDRLERSASGTHWVTFPDGACLVWNPVHLTGGDA